AASLSPVAACGPTSPGPTSPGPPSPPPAPATPGPRPAVPRLSAAPPNPLFAAAPPLPAPAPAEAAGPRAIPRTPSSFWAAGQPGEMQMVRQVTRAAARHHSVPVIVAYNLPHRDACGKFSAGQETGAAGYRHWIGRLAAAIGGGDDIVIVEPDGLLDILRPCLSASQDSQRYQPLRDAMKVLRPPPPPPGYPDA